MKRKTCPVTLRSSPPASPPRLTLSPLLASSPTSQGLPPERIGARANFATWCPSPAVPQLLSLSLTRPAVWECRHIAIVSAAFRASRMPGRRFPHPHNFSAIEAGEEKKRRSPRVTRISVSEEPLSGIKRVFFCRTQSSPSSVPLGIASRSVCASFSLSHLLFTLRYKASLSLFLSSSTPDVTTQPFRRHTFYTRNRNSYRTTHRILTLRAFSFLFRSGYYESARILFFTTRFELSFRTLPFCKLCDKSQEGTKFK